MRQVIYRIVNSLIVAKGKDYGKCVDSSYGAKYLLESSIDVFKRMIENKKLTIEDSVDEYILDLNKFTSVDYNSNLRSHLIEIVTIYVIVSTPTHPLSDNALFDPKEFLETLEQAV